MKKVRKENIKNIVMCTLAILVVIMLYNIVGKLEKQASERYKKEKEEIETTAITEPTNLSKIEADIESAKKNEMLDFEDDRVWFNDNDEILSNFFPLSANALKSEMVTKFLRATDYSTNSITVISDTARKDGNLYSVECSIDGTDDNVIITWDTYKGLFSYYLKVNRVGGR